MTMTPLADICTMLIIITVYSKYFSLHLLLPEIDGNLRHFHRWDQHFNRTDFNNTFPFEFAWGIFPLACCLKCFLRELGSVYRFGQPGTWQAYGFYKRTRNNIITALKFWLKSLQVCGKKRTTDILNWVLTSLTVSWCVLWCFALSDELLNAFGQPRCWQRYGFSPVCDRIWIFRFSSLENALLHPGN